jgi:L-2,4-diaminobutyric acid acetyltransferase
VIAITNTATVDSAIGGTPISRLLSSLHMAAPAESPIIVNPNTGQVSIETPAPADGVACWRLARSTGVLDVNSRYAYLLWFRDFAATSVVARIDGAVAGFVSGYLRPGQPGTLMVWQVAVAAEARGHGVAAAMLDGLVDRVPAVDHVEATVTPGNAGSIALFTRFAERRSAAVSRSELFGSELLGDGHEPEILFRIGPLDR